MILPVPPIILDLFLTFNITVAIIILLVAVYVKKPLDFSTFPILLLVMTLFRLSLNVASTRLILLHGADGPEAAGQVIKSFGNFVVGGNYAVGFVLFEECVCPYHETQELRLVSEVERGRQGEDNENHQASLSG